MIPEDLRLPSGIERPFLTKESVQCGRPNCRCAKGGLGGLHGPYHFLRFEFHGADESAHHLGRRYVKGESLAGVRGWLRRRRAREERSRRVLAFLQGRGSFSAAFGDSPADHGRIHRQLVRAVVDGLEKGGRFSLSFMKIAARIELRSSRDKERLRQIPIPPDAGHRVDDVR